MLGQKLRLLRKENLISSKALAAQLGVSRQLLGQWESGEAEPDRVTISRLTVILNTTADYLTNDEIIVATPGKLRPAFHPRLISIIAILPFLLGAKGAIEGLVICHNLNNIQYGLEQENLKAGIFVEMDVSREQFWGNWDRSNFLPFAGADAYTQGIVYTIRLDKAGDYSITFIVQKDHARDIERIVRDGSTYHFSAKIIKHELFYEGIAMFLSPDEVRLADIVLSPTDKNAIAEIVSPNFAISTYDIAKEKRVLNNGLGWLLVAVLVFFATSVTLERKERGRSSL
jgi:transcriptional regulator with XRE-family HTH domain